jgi:hypothetical protein
VVYAHGASQQRREDAAVSENLAAALQKTTIHLHDAHATADAADAADAFDIIVVRIGPFGVV